MNGRLYLHQIILHCSATSHYDSISQLWKQTWKDTNTISSRSSRKSNWTHIVVSQPSFKPALKANMRGNKLKRVQEFTKNKVRRTFFLLENCVRLEVEQFSRYSRVCRQCQTVYHPSSCHHTAYVHSAWVFGRLTGGRFNRAVTNPFPPSLARDSSSYITTWLVCGQCSGVSRLGLAVRRSFW